MQILNVFAECKLKINESEYRSIISPFKKKKKKQGKGMNNVAY